MVPRRSFSACFRLIQPAGRGASVSGTEKGAFRRMRLPFWLVRVKPSISTGRARTQRYTSSDGTRVPSDRFRPHCSGLSEPRGIAFSRRWPGLTCPVHGVEGRDWIVASPPWKRGSSQWPGSNPGPRKGRFRVDDCRRRDPMTVFSFSLNCWCCGRPKSVALMPRGGPRQAPSGRPQRRTPMHLGRLGHFRPRS